jgi:hypothetical protein
MGATRVLVANELASYRQTIAVVLGELHPDLEVFEVDAEVLDEEVLDEEVVRLGPDLVICSRLTCVVRERVANWVELYPERKPYSTFCTGGERRALRDVQLSDLLALCASLP